MIQKKVRLGIIGIGNMGSEHCRLILGGRCPETELRAVADAYSRFLLGVAAGEEHEALERMLNAADEKLEEAYEKRGKDNHRQR